jgi:hypothetical protein
MQVQKLLVQNLQEGGSIANTASLLLKVSTRNKVSSNLPAKASAPLAFSLSKLFLFLAMV